jgi:hypothetical protein
MECRGKLSSAQYLRIVILNYTEVGTLVCVLMVLTTWRLSCMIVFESGPFRIFDQLRKLFIRAGAARLATCVHCVSVWVAIAVVTLTFEPSLDFALYIPAIAGATSALELLLSRKRAEIETEE